VLQCVAVCYSVLHCVAVCCIVLQCVAMCCNVLFSGATDSREKICLGTIYIMFTMIKYCYNDYVGLYSRFTHSTQSDMQGASTKTHCNTLQHATTHKVYNTVQT